MQESKIRLSNLFNGTISRKNYRYLSILINPIFLYFFVYVSNTFSMIIPFILSHFIPMLAAITIVSYFPLTIIYALLVISIMVRRLHDIDKPWWYILFMLIPGIGFGFYIYLLTAQKSTPSGNSDITSKNTSSWRDLLFNKAHISSQKNIFTGRITRLPFLLAMIVLNPLAFYFGKFLLYAPCMVILEFIHNLLKNHLSKPISCISCDLQTIYNIGIRLNLPYALNVLITWSWILFLICTIPIIAMLGCLSLSFFVRRLHDIGLSENYVWLIFIPFIGFLFMIYLFFAPSNKTSNNFEEPVHEQ